MATIAQSVADVCAQAKRAARELAHARHRHEERRARGDGRRARAAHATRSSRRTRATWRPARRPVSTPGLLDRLKLDEERLVGHRPRRALDRRAARPGGRDDRRPPAGERPRRSPRARAARRGGGGLRGAAERDRRLLGAVPQVGQRDRAARVVHGRALERGAGAGGLAAVAWAGVPEGAISIVSGGDRDELRQIATQDGVVDLVIPRGGEGLKEALKEHATVPVIYAAGGQLPRLRGRERRPRRRGRDHREREGPAARRSATRPRRCWCTPTSRRTSCRARSASCASRGWSCAWTAARARWPASSATRSPRPPRRTGRPSTTR